MMSLVLLLAGLAVFFTIALKLREEVADMPAKLIKAPAGPEAYLKN